MRVFRFGQKQYGTVQGFGVLLRLDCSIILVLLLILKGSTGKHSVVWFYTKPLRVPSEEQERTGSCFKLQSKFSRFSKSQARLKKWLDQGSLDGSS